MVAPDIYIYTITRISEEGFLEKTVETIRCPAGAEEIVQLDDGRVGYRTAKGVSPLEP
jgi:hypothetical protein